DEIQCGFGRNGTLWAFEQFGIVPDILLLGKALGGGMPLGAFIASHQLMQSLTHQPVLGHITTFGGHPVSCAAGNAALLELLENEWMKEVPVKEQILKEKLQHPAIKILRTAGLWASISFNNFELNKQIVHNAVKNGLVTDWFLFNNCAMRIAPPLCISKEQLTEACNTILKVIDNTINNNN
ncbi:MAG: aminotransferase class III-fold pyridoxal phosphate-dependent enzyme, partial [Chitinophagaceae bacterium]